jgi:phosphatidate phosphatase APP1
MRLSLLALLSAHAWAEPKVLLFSALVTNVVKTSGLFEAALLQDENSQPAVPGMAQWYACLRQNAAARPGLAFVSGSPHGFPPSGLYLRNMGPSTLSGYKQPVLRTLLTRFSQPLVLIGDSGEKDPEVYAEIRRESPGRIRRIYIRAAGGPQRATRFEQMVRFTDAKEAALDSRAQGLADEACVRDHFGR